MTFTQERAPRFVGWRVHTWAYPVVWWARRKPRSNFRQWLWRQTDRIKMRLLMRYWRKLQRMTPDEKRAHIRKRWARS